MTKRMSFSIRHLRSTRSCQGRHASLPDGATNWRTPSVLLRLTVWNFWLNSRSPCCAGLDNFESITFCLLSHGAYYPSLQSTPTAGPWYKLSLSYLVLNNGFDGTFLLNQGSSIRELLLFQISGQLWHSGSGTQICSFFCQWGCSDEGLLYKHIGQITTKHLLHFLIALGNILNGTNAIFTKKWKCSLPRVT